MSDICAPWAGVDVFVRERGEKGKKGRGERSASVCGYAEIGDG